MTGVVLLVRGLEGAYGGQSATRSARPGEYSAPLSPAVPCRGGSASIRSDDV